LAQIRFTFRTSEVISHRKLYCSGVAMLMSPGADHKHASSFHSLHLLTTIQNERKSCSSDGVLRLGLGLETGLETRFLESRSRSRRSQVSSRSRRISVSVWSS